MSEIRPAVKAVIERNGKVLVLKTETPERTYHVLPGGKIDYGETPREALERELVEEISCKASIGDVYGTYHFFTGADDDGMQIVVTAFKASIGDREVDIGSNPAEDENITEASWMTLDDLEEKCSNDSLIEMLRSQL